MMQLAVRLVPVDDTTLVIALTGELDSTTRPVLAAFLDPLPQSPVRFVLVNAGDLWFCDLNGLEQLAITHRALRAKGGHLAVAEPQPPLRRLIALMAEQKHPSIPVYASMPEALAEAGVAAYETALVPSPARRHLPRMRSMPRVPLMGRPRTRTAEPAPPPHEPPVPAPPLVIEPASGPLPLVIHQSRLLRERAEHERQELTRQLISVKQARTTLITARQRCGASLEVMRVSLRNAWSALAIDHDSAVSRPHFHQSFS